MEDTVEDMEVTAVVMEDTTVNLLVFDVVALPLPRYASQLNILDELR